MNKLQVVSFLLVIAGMVAYLTACHDGGGGDLSSAAIDEGKKSDAVAGNVAPVAPIPEPLPPPMVEAPFVLDERNDDYFGSQRAIKPADTGNEDSCGNGQVEENEECDDANVENGTLCKDCKIVRENCSVHIGEGSQYIYCTGNDDIAEDGTNISINGTETWSNAQEVCRKFGPFDLVTISSSAETTFLGSFITENAWIGINDIENEGAFVWVSGIPVTYTNWASGEPNNDGNQDCGLFYPTVFTWDDLGCGTQLSFVCELENDDATLLEEPLDQQPTDPSGQQPNNEEEVDGELNDQPEGEGLNEQVDGSGEIPADATGEEGIESPVTDELDQQPWPNETEPPADQALEQPIADETEHHFEEVIEEPAAETEHHVDDGIRQPSRDELEHHFEEGVNEPVSAGSIIQ